MVRSIDRQARRFGRALTIASLAIGFIAVEPPPLWAADAPASAQSAENQGSEARTPHIVDHLALRGQKPFPGPTVISQIHNAPGWRRDHIYRFHEGPFTRVVNGPGWNESADTYNPGRVLNAYQLISTGSCTSADRNGPTGTGSHINDGTCTWEYLSPVDYVSITGWTFDNQHWKAGTAYPYGDYVVSDSPLRAYEQMNSMGCKSTAAPTGTAYGSGTEFTTADRCRWKYWADILYSSEKSYIPTQRYPTKGKLDATVELKANYEAEIWNDREYVAGENGEAVPIRLQAHFDYTQDDFPYSSEGNASCNQKCYSIILAAAPGESFADRLTPVDPLVGYEPKDGVAIRNPTSRLSDGFEIRDNGVHLIGLQVKSDYGIGVGGGQTHGGNYVTIRHSIVEGGNGADAAAINLDTWMLVENSLVISHSRYGIVEDYPGSIVYSTIVNPDRVANSIAFEVGLDWQWTGETVSNTAIFGFAHVAGSMADPRATDWHGITWLGGHNATDAPVGDSGAFPFADNRTVSIKTLPGTIYGISAKSVFKAFPGDYRLATGSPLIGAGRPIGAFSPSCLTNKPCPGYYTFDSPDIIGTARPQAARYDIGAWQSCASVSADGRRCASSH
jgi:hypothetical protein